MSIGINPRDIRENMTSTRKYMGYNSSIPKNSIWLSNKARLLQFKYGGDRGPDGYTMGGKYGRHRLMINNAEQRAQFARSNPNIAAYLRGKPNSALMYGRVSHIPPIRSVSTAKSMGKDATIAKNLTRFITGKRAAIGGAALGGMYMIHRHNQTKNNQGIY